MIINLYKIRLRIHDLICFIILSIPLFWIFGVEQFILSVVLSVVLLFISIKRKIYFDKITLLLLVFIITYIISGLFIEEGYRFLTYFRGLGGYMSALLILLIFKNIKLNNLERERIINSIIIVTTISCLIGILSITGIFLNRFPSIISPIIPEFIKSSNYGNLIAFRSTGYDSWFTGIGSYYRVSSIFMYPSMYASALAILIPLICYKYAISTRGTVKIVLIILIFMAGFNLLLTTGRAAIISLIIGLLIYLYFSIIIGSKYKKLFLVIISVTMIVITIIIIDSIGYNNIKDALILARGEGSPTARATVYLATLEGFMERPFFGWGTERDVPGVRYPAGSHSFYLGLLYKHGAIGLFLILILLILIYKRITDIKKLTNEKYIIFLQVVFIIFIINSITDTFELDSTLFFLLWVIISIGLYQVNSGKNVVIIK